ncbi:unnamed protein product [Rotaria sordida]|uniref:Uncharacterized protein n=1 Tax=Rotaria sordida TaxID=392033 RepID=A0A814UMI0_9BILA|nr:unnamed protein product [Rotaria sordida]CAF1434927.1 unnamed protein product [Rotaria sordida]
MTRSHIHIHPHPQELRDPSQNSVNLPQEFNLAPPDALPQRARFINNNNNNNITQPFIVNEENNNPIQQEQ